MLTYKWLGNSALERAYAWLSRDPRLLKPSQRSDNGTATSLRREAQQVCLIFQTTAATSSKDKKQLENKAQINVFKIHLKYAVKENNIR